MATLPQDSAQDPGEKPTKATTRTYIVLELASEDSDIPGVKRVWHELDETAEAGTDRQAIAAVTNPSREGTWTGVPTRSWNPRTRKFDQPPPKPVWS